LQVAKEILFQLNPSLNVISYTDNIKDPKFNIEFYKQFTLVFLALDNEEARSHVNRYCMLLKIPISDAGTNGYNGQAMMLLKNSTRCYDCHTRQAPKTFQVCTIRTTPEKPIHCLIWAKNLFNLLFGPPCDDNLLSDLTQDLSNETNQSTNYTKVIHIFNYVFFTMVNDQKNSGEDHKFKG
jgi:molybdopterin/thiamine biosynthesis adenylyltransferase